MSLLWTKKYYTLRVKSILRSAFYVNQKSSCLRFRLPARVVAGSPVSGGWSASFHWVIGRIRAPRWLPPATTSAWMWAPSCSYRGSARQWGPRSVNQGPFCQSCRPDPRFTIPFFVMPKQWLNEAWIFSKFTPALSSLTSSNYLARMFFSRHARLLFLFLLHFVHRAELAPAIQLVQRGYSQAELIAQDDLGHFYVLLLEERVLFGDYILFLLLLSLALRAFGLIRNRNAQVLQGAPHNHTLLGVNGRRMMRAGLNADKIELALYHARVLQGLHIAMA